MSEKVLAVAAGHEITEKELDELIRNYPADQQIYLSNPRAKAQVLEQLIAFHLFAKMAEEEKITETEEYNKTIEKMKVELASHMAATRSIESAVVTEEEEKAFYEANKAQFVKEPQVSAKHILVDTEELASKVADEIAAGKAFEDAAREYSTCPSKEQGGNLGEFGRGQMVPEFDSAVFSMDVGEVTETPVKTQFGYHLIRLNKKSTGEKIPFPEVKDRIKEALLAEKQQKAYSSKVAQLKILYPVDILG